MSYPHNNNSYQSSSSDLLLEAGGKEDSFKDNINGPSSPAVFPAFSGNTGSKARRRHARILISVVSLVVAVPLLYILGFIGNGGHASSLTQRLHLTGQAGWTYITPKPVELPHVYEGQYTHNPINSTLGFQKIIVINLPHRRDKRNEMLLLAEMSGLELEFVYTKTMDQLGKNELPYYGKMAHEKGSVGVARAHADAWEHMIAKGYESALILEDDGDWDVDWRYAFQQLQQPFAQLLRSVDDGRAEKQKASMTPTPENPWLTNEWDLFNFGPCLEYPWGTGDRAVNMTNPLVKDNMKPPHIMYDDKTMPFQESNGFFLIEIFKLFGRPWAKKEDPPTDVVPQRMVTLAHTPVCMNAYALSRKGATRFLHYTTREMYAPIDIMLSEFAATDRLRSYEVIPPIMSQWKIKDNHARASDNLLATASKTPEDLARYKAKVEAAEADQTLNHNPSVGRSDFIKNSLREAIPAILGDRTRSWPV